MNTDNLPGLSSLDLFEVLFEGEGKLVRVVSVGHTFKKPLCGFSASYRHK